MTRTILDRSLADVLPEGGMELRLGGATSDEVYLLVRMLKEEAGGADAPTGQLALGSLTAWLFAQHLLKVNHSCPEACFGFCRE